MKTAISMPDATFERVTKTAADLGLSRSELFVRAAINYLDQLEAESLTSRINAALDEAGPDPDVHLVVAAGKRRLRQSTDEW